MEKLSCLINRAVEVVLFGLGAGMALIVAVQVFFRYGLNHSIFWSEELARYGLVWLTFLGATTAYKLRFHPGVDLLFQRMPGNIEKMSALLVHLFSCFFFTVMVIYGIRFAWFVRMQISPALGVPKWIIYGIVPVVGLFLMIHGLVFLFNEVKRNGK
ncbi:MAG: TRAP transporter small permease [Pseudomonadota bacterium]